MNNDFINIKNKVLELIRDKEEITSKTNYKKGGIYLLYVDNFDDDKIIPIYIGKTNNFQERHKEHLKELFAINRLSRKYYVSAVVSKYYEGNYKSCKIFKYLIDKQCTVKNLHMLILEECEDEEKRTYLENEYINEYLTSFFGFNQLNTLSLQKDYENNGILSNVYLNNVKTDIVNIEKYKSYGFNVFNYLLSKGLFERYENEMANKLNIIDEFDCLYKLNKKQYSVIEKKHKLIHYITYTSNEECKKLCSNIIDSFFEKNNLKSEDKKKQIIKYLLFRKENDKLDVEKYINRFAVNKNENIFNLLLSKVETEINQICNTIKDYQNKIAEYEEEIYKLRLLIFKSIIPEKEYISFPLKDTYQFNNEVEIKEENTLYINIEFSNFGKRVMSDDYPCILKIDYLFNKNGRIIENSYFISSSFDNFFENNDEYYINVKLGFLRFDPFNIWKYSEKRNYDTISTTMEYYNGINEYTLRDKTKHNLIDVVNEIDNIIDEDTNVIYNSFAKGIIKRYRYDIFKDSIIMQKIFKEVKK